MTFTLPCLALLLAPGADKPAAYPRPELLVEPADVLKLADTRILDARGKGSYLDGHFPGAVWVDAVGWSRAFGDGKDVDGWSKRVGALGIDVNTTVVIYDDSMSKDAARVWWILRYWGVKDVRLVNGWPGLAWLVGPGLAKDDFKPAPKDPKLNVQADRLATKAQMLAALKDRPFQILDARSDGEFCGTEETAKKNGAIPGALHLEWSDALDRKTQRFKSASELTKLFKDAGIDPTKPATTYCQSGGRAAVLAFTVELMGGKEVRNYYRSWAEWGNAEDTPVENGKAKK
ncbi:MAG TPA: rhodanese-like domain-containing protein [Gemmataceae bacterium]|jgi:thiosulfate/3-mercaptopyruvate sulfurtransferase|nr:rhodanese-like domain-containing protein [Gemmataceae bacterium]